jgi:4-hydroxy-tetrahydrodipicolinate reductase
LIRVLLFGAEGRFGKLITAELNQQDDISMIAGVECQGHKAITDSGIISDEDNLPDADVWVDASIADAAIKHIRKASKLGKAIVVAATGFSDKDNIEIQKLAVSCPILLVSNLSTGIGVMDRLVNKASKLLGQEFESVLFEMHHSAKADAPSGTALRLAESAGIDNKPEKVAALRAGGAIGEHHIHFVGEFEELVISHRAWSRQAFSKGVPRAIRFIYTKAPGLYSINDLYKVD